MRSPTSYTVAEVVGFLSRTPIRMYCRNCYYDLRGQENLRCPECGTEFDPDDPKSYCPAMPGYFSRVCANIRRWRIAIGTVLTVAVFSLIVLFFSAMARNPVSDTLRRSIHRSALRSILTVSMMVQNEIYPDLRLDLPAIRKQLSPGYSCGHGADTFQSACRLRSFLYDSPVLTMVASCYLVSMLWLWRRNTRVAVIVSSMLLLLSVLGRMYTSEVASTLFPKSTSYVDDFVLLDDAESSPGPTRHVVAYEKTPSGSHGKRLVGFGYSDLVWMTDSEFLPLLESQGVRFRGVCQQIARTRTADK